MAQKACLNKQIVIKNNLFTTNYKTIYSNLFLLTHMNVIDSLMG